MKSWAAVSVPALPGQAPPLRLYDSATRSVRAAAVGPVARMYVCGITPYDATHLGHAFTYVTFDVVNRLWRDAGLDVHYVQNVTDIDDPLLDRAAQTGQDWSALAARETDLFRDDMAALNVLPPQDYVGAVESITSIVAHIARLRELGAVYEIDADVYFRVRSAPGFGDVAHLDDAAMTALVAERGGDPGRIGKEHPLDCLVWQAQRPGEPAWETGAGSDLPPGRPGWHIECAAIALDHLGSTFDVQGGGTDLLFPHHEMTAAEGWLLAGAPFARHYTHSAMVGWQGAKMSKSRGNLVLVSRLRGDGAEPAAIRLALLAHHYRTDWEWTEADLRRADVRLARWRTACEAAGGPPAAGLVERMRAHLSDDLDAPAAIGAVDEWVAASMSGDRSDAAAPELVRRAVDALLGVRL